jgi:hypothetical protein
VAELRPKKIKKLVYLTAFLVPNGTSFFSAVKGVEGSKAVENFYLSEDKSVALVTEDKMHLAFAHDIPEDNFNAAKPYIVAKPATPLSYALEVTEAILAVYRSTILNVRNTKRSQLRFNVQCIAGRLRKHVA